MCSQITKPFIQKTYVYFKQYIIIYQRLSYFYQKIWLHSQNQDALIDKTILYILYSSGLYFTDIRRWFQSHFQVKHWTYLPIAMGNAWTAHKQLDIKVNFTAKRFHMLNWNNNEVWLQDPYEDSITWPDIFIEGHIFV